MTILTYKQDSVVFIPQIKIQNNSYLKTVFFTVSVVDMKKKNRNSKLSISKSCFSTTIHPEASTFSQSES